MYYLNLLPLTLTYNHVVARANTTYQCYEPRIPTTRLTFAYNYTNHAITLSIEVTGSNYRSSKMQ